MVKTLAGPSWRTFSQRALVALFFTTAATIHAAPVSLPYFENFDSGSSLLVSSTTTSTTWSYTAQKLRCAITANNQNPAATVEAPVMPTGFHMEANMTVSTNGDATTNSCGFGFLGADPTFAGGGGAPYYLVDVKPGANSMRLLEVNTSNTTLISESLEFTLVPTQKFTLQIDGEPDNGSLILTVTILQNGHVSTHSIREDLPLSGKFFGARLRTNSGALTVDYDDFWLHANRTLAFSSPPSGFAKPGIAYSSNVTAQASDGGPVTLTGIDLPPWLSLSPTTNGSAILSGTPPSGTTGTTLVKIQAADGNGEPVIAEFPLAMLGISGVIISEFAASNNGSYLDEDGDDSDWLELLNADSTPADLTGWSLKDDSASWSIPAGTIIPPFGTLVIFASDKNRTTPRLHTNFKLSSSAGGYLALVRPDNSLASVYSNYPVQREGVTYGAWGDYQTIGYLLTPTPGAANAARGVIGFTPDPTFSVGRSYYSSPQAVVISDTLPGSSIRYTLDGSLPTVTHGILVSPINATTPPTTTLTISSTSVVRAVAYLDNYAISTAITNSYFFASDIVNQSNDGSAPAGFPTGPVNGQVLDYGIDKTDVLNTPAAIDSFKTALRSLPTFSIVTDNAHLFSAATGIYVNAYNREDEWERPTSVEMIKPDGSSAFQINCGIRMRGGVSRADDDPKHAFHLYFRGEYGPKKLAYPLFDSEGASEFDRIDLRCTQGNSWHQANSSIATYMQDEWSRATQGAMGHANTKSRYLHLFINGQYWGIYTTEERADDSFAASYFGGEKEDYDVVKNYTKPAHHVAVADGDGTSWTALFNAATVGFVNDADYYAVQGLDANGRPSPTLKPLVEIDELIDYMLLSMFTGNGDGPVNPSANVPKNFFCFRPRDGTAGFRFVAHDFEDTFTAKDVTGIYADAHPPAAAPLVVGATLDYFNPRWLHIQLAKNAKYRQRFADRAQKNLFNGGPLSVTSAGARWDALRATLDPAIIAESARWGDAKSSSPHTYSQWTSASSGIYKAANRAPVTANPSGFLTTRQAGLITQLRNTPVPPLFPAVNAPSLTPFGGVAIPSSTVTITGPSGAQIYYTTDGTDPSDLGAILYTAPVAITNAVTNLKSRAKAAGEWSALVEARYTFTPVPAAAGNLILSEISYNPPSADDLDEFIEVMNPSNALVELNGVKITTGVTFTFPALLLEPGQRAVVIKDAAGFKATYGSAATYAGIWDGSLKQDGEPIVLVAANGTEIERVVYSSALPWPTAAAGNGRTLVRIRPDLTANSPYSWRSSNLTNGTPGGSDAGSLAAWLVQSGLANAASIAPSGMKALLHYASGTPINSSLLPEMKIIRSTTNVKVTMRRGISAIDDVRTFIDQSPDLVTWPVSTELDSAASTVTLRSAEGDGNETVTVQIPTTAAMGFYRLRYVTR